MKSEESQPRPCVAEATMTSSRCEVDNGGSNSSINTPDPNLDSHATENTSQPFVNHGYLMWNQSRQQWVGKSRKSNNKDQICEPRLSYNATYDTLLGSNKPFTKPVPLSEMVDFLVDVWEKEGMYD